MNNSRIVLCTLILNEMEWLPKLYQQHMDWPGMIQWIFVEAADQVYAETNPDRVSSDGLSVDGTTVYLQQLSSQDDRITHIRHGLARHTNRAQGKCAARRRYLQEADGYSPKFLYVIDGDEFYPHDDQRVISSTMVGSPRQVTSFCYRQRHIWHPPSIHTTPLLGQEVVGGFWDIPHCRGWRWQPGLTYHSNHNTPETTDGRLLDKRMGAFYQRADTPQCVHLGFASTLASRHAKNAYYAARGEGIVDHRGWYVESRAAYETWSPGDTLPRGAQVIPYTGPIPECWSNP